MTDNDITREDILAEWFPCDSYDGLDNQRQLEEEKAEYNDNYSSSNDDGWFYSDED